MGGSKIFLSVGDESGDLHASNLMRAVRALEPSVVFTGFGMRRMVQAGLEQLDADEESPGGAMWLYNIFHAARFQRRLDACRKLFRTSPPDLVVLVNFGGFNLYVAKAASRAGIPVLYYILPQVWAHGTYRLKKIRRWVTKALVIYPFEPALYRRFGVEAEYVGHPLFDELARSPVTDEEVQRVKSGVGGRIVALFPGSRKQEVGANLPLMLRACREVQRGCPEVRFALICPEPLRLLAGQLISRQAVEVSLSDARPVALARAADVCLTKSGTITLEIASQLCPAVILYRLHPFLLFVAHGLAETPYIGIVNSLAGRMVCPERPMARADSAWAADRVLELLLDQSRRDECRRGIASAIEPIAKPGASERAARAALELLSRNRS
jgi:lipid-A-disaccharide synthase